MVTASAISGISHLAAVQHGMSAKAKGGGMQPLFASVLEAGSNSHINPAGRIVEDKLAGLLLADMVKSILPDQTTALFNESRFNEMWGSYMADALAEAMRSSGKIDLGLSRG